MNLFFQRVVGPSIAQLVEWRTVMDVFFKELVNYPNPLLIFFFYIINTIKVNLLFQKLLIRQAPKMYYT